MTLTFSIVACLSSILWLLWILRRDSCSFGLPLAYLFALLLIHVPGAIAHLVGGDVLRHSDLTEVSLGFTAIGALCYVGGVYFGRRSAPRVPALGRADRKGFWSFCLLCGWLFTFGLIGLQKIPSIGAAFNKGASIWMLGVLLGLRAAVQSVDPKRAGFWLGALMVHPVVGLLFSGFPSYGATAVIIVISSLAISTRSYWRVVVGIVVIGYVTLSVFAVYFQHRRAIRNQVWGGAALEDRIATLTDTAADFQWLDLSNDKHLKALDLRLNQNYFVGLASQRIQDGQVSYLYGRSVWEGLLAVIPRALWPDKPVFGGSPAIVREMTGLHLSERTSWGVGNVMEFHINFGLPGVIVGFFCLGVVFGWLDRSAVLAERSGALDRSILFFLPAVALIEPNGSLVELSGGTAAALGAAIAWDALWNYWVRRPMMFRRDWRRLRIPDTASFPASGRR